ncbi:MAG: hypothetical protein JWO31_822, partial [Phycisphaerales bacterium]|nr:hypothetical protein [Phycisphaerales bacterium]
MAVARPACWPAFGPEPLEARRLFAVDVVPGFAAAAFATGLDRPTAVAVAPDGRLFVTEQGGDLRVVGLDGVVAAAPVVSLTVDDRGERGLLGVTLDPAFADYGYVYLYYTVPERILDEPAGVAPVHNRVSRFTASGDVAVAGSEKVLLDQPALGTATNHNGG